MNVGKRIREIRKSAGMTQAEFAQRLGVMWYKVKDLESGRLKITEELAKKINREFHINYKWVLTGEEPKEQVWHEETGPLYITIDAGPFTDLYDVGVSAKIAEKIKMAETGNNAEPLEKPVKSEVTVRIDFHNANVIAHVLARADGKCEECHGPAPFIRSSDNMPYLEFHRLRTASDKEDESPEDFIALCPNCHRKVHYG